MTCNMVDFAGSVRAYQRHDFLFVDIEGNIPEGLDVTIISINVITFNTLGISQIHLDNFFIGSDLLRCSFCQFPAMMEHYDLFRYAHNRLPSRVQS